MYLTGYNFIRCDSNTKAGGVGFSINNNFLFTRAN